MIGLIKREARERDSGNGINPNFVLQEPCDEKQLHDAMRDQDERPKVLNLHRHARETMEEESPNGIPLLFREFVAENEKYEIVDGLGGQEIKEETKRHFGEAVHGLQKNACLKDGVEGSSRKELHFGNFTFSVSPAGGRE
jgi:hypothetical protein